MDTLNQQLGKMRSEAETIFKAAVTRVDPYKAIMEFVKVEEDKLHLGKNEATLELDLQNYDRIFLVGGGKATAPMALAMEELLKDRIKGGVVVVKYGFTDPLSFTEILEADHPLPDQNGVDGTKKILDVLDKAGEKDLVFSLISGGGSALLPQPAGNITLEEKQAMTKNLLECGASIDEINTIRKHISLSKGGQMARAAFPASIVNMMLSDVVGDKMDVIASGPFVPDGTTFESAANIFKKYQLKDIPESIREHIGGGAKGEIPDTPKEGDSVFERVHNFIIGSNIIALEAAKAAAEEMGYNTLILSSMVEGETRDVALVHTAIAREILETGNPLKAPACIISGGETTVTIKGDGKGGRNQEFGLAAAIDIQGLPGEVVLMSGGTDGNDGPTPAAGAFADPMTVQRGRDQGMNANEYMNNNDTFHYFEKTGELLITGPTKTNVMDVRLVLVR